MINKKIDDDKAFEATLKGKIGWKCSCSLDIMDNKTTLIEKTCKKRFKTNKEKDYCMSCS